MLKNILIEFLLGWRMGVLFVGKIVEGFERRVFNYIFDLYYRVGKVE